VRPGRSNPDPSEREDSDHEHRRGLDAQPPEFQGHRGRHSIEQAGTEDVRRDVNGLAKLATCIAEGAALAGKNTDEVKRKMKNANVDTIWNVSDDFRTTDRAMANAPKNIVPRNSAPAMRSAPSQVGAKLAPNTGNARPNTRREPATPMISVAKMMLRMYWARVKGPSGAARTFRSSGQTRAAFPRWCLR